MVNIGLRTKRREARQTGLCQGLTNCTPECKEKKVGDNSEINQITTHMNGVPKLILFRVLQIFFKKNRQAF